MHKPLLASAFALAAGLFGTSAHAFCSPGQQCGGANGGPPTVPQNLSAPAVSSTSITLKWDASTDDSVVANYFVYANGSSTLLGNVTQYTYAALTAGQTYAFQVKACDDNSACSALSSTLSVTTPVPNTAPTVPTGLTAVYNNACPIGMKVDWQASTDDQAVSNYKLYRGNDLLATLTSPTRTYLDTAIALSAQYSYKVLACDAQNLCSAASSDVLVSAPASANCGMQVSGTATGSLTSQTIKVSLTPHPNDMGKQGSVFVAALLPASLGGGVYFLDRTGAWTLYSSCANAPAYFSGPLASLTDEPVSNGRDMSGLVGTQFYVGTGQGGPLSPTGTACTNMLNNGTYQLVHTIQ